MPEHLEDQAEYRMTAHAALESLGLSVTEDGE